MSTADVLGLLFRWLHILAAMTAVGGTIFARFVVLPAHAGLTPQARESLHAEMRRRWSKIVMASIGFLIISGFYNFFMIFQNYGVELKALKWYHPLFGVKFLLAMVVFAIASLLSGRTALADKIRRSARLWMSVNILLAVIIVCISGILRTGHPPGNPVIPSESAVKAK